MAKIKEAGQVKKLVDEILGRRRDDGLFWYQNSEKYKENLKTELDRLDVEGDIYLAAGMAMVKSFSGMEFGKYELFCSGISPHNEMTFLARDLVKRKRRDESLIYRLFGKQFDRTRTERIEHEFSVRYKDALLAAFNELGVYNVPETGKKACIGALI